MAPTFCTFDGTAEALRVEGEGRAVLVEPAPFEDGQATSVFLVGATITPGLANPRIERPAPLVPLTLNPKGRPFDVKYAAGPPLVIDVAAGGADGAYAGPLPDGTNCPLPDWCPVVWAGPRKHIELARAAGGAFPIAQNFPYGVEASGGASSGQPSPGGAGASSSQLSALELHDARGELRCGQSVEAIAGSFRWDAGPLRALALRGPDAKGARKAIWVEGAAFRVHVENDLPPSPLARGAWPGGLALAVVGALAAFAAIARATFLRRRPGRVASGGARPPVAPGAGGAPVRVFVSFAARDGGHADRLLAHLAALKLAGRIELVTSRDVAPGADLRAEVARALCAAELIVPIVSADYLASDAHYDQELSRAVARHAAGVARVVPILAEPVDLAGLALEGLQCLPAAPPGAAPKAVSTFANQEAVWADVAARLRQLVDDLARARIKAER